MFEGKLKNEYTFRGTVFIAPLCIFGNNHDQGNMKIIIIIIIIIVVVVVVVVVMMCFITIDNKS